MGLADDVKTVLDANWDATIIAEPTYKVDPRFTNNAIIRTLYINSREAGRLQADSLDGDSDVRITPFVIVGYEASEANAILAIKAIKKVLHKYALTEGWYRITTFLIEEEQRITKYTLGCEQYIHINYDSW